MKEQPTFADLDYQHKRRRTRREEFLERIDSLIPWQRLEGLSLSKVGAVEKVGTERQLGQGEWCQRHGWEEDDARATGPLPKRLHPVPIHNKAVEGLHRSQPL